MFNNIYIAKCSTIYIYSKMFNNIYIAKDSEIREKKALHVMVMAKENK